LPLKRIHIRVRVKRAIAYLLEGVESNSISKLLDAKALLLECLNAINVAATSSPAPSGTAKPGAKKRGAKAAPQEPQPGMQQLNLFELDRAIILLQLARVLIAKHEIDVAAHPTYEDSWSLQRATPSTSESAPAPAPTTKAGRGKKAGGSAKTASAGAAPSTGTATSAQRDPDLAEAERFLTAALSAATKSGATPRLTSDICHSLALLIGNTDKRRVAALMSFAQGVTMRHQMIAAAFEKISNIKLRQIKLAREESDPSYLGSFAMRYR
jgi:hypothetical protein